MHHVRLGYLKQLSVGSLVNRAFLNRHELMMLSHFKHKGDWRTHFLVDRTMKSCVSVMNTQLFGLFTLKHIYIGRKLYSRPYLYYVMLELEFKYVSKSNRNAINSNWKIWQHCNAKSVANLCYEWFNWFDLNKIMAFFCSIQIRIKHMY